MAVVDDQFGPCSIGRAADVLGDRWTLLIMRSALIGMTRFDQLKAHLGIADNILSNRLGKLVDAGLLMKQPYTEGNRVRQHYVITEAGAGLRPVLQALAAWGHEFVHPDDPTRPVSVVHTVCGQTSADGLHCDTCGVDLSPTDVAWVLPWLSEDAIALQTPHPSADHS